MSAERTRVCPICGAVNTPVATTCVACRKPLPPRASTAAFWNDQGGSGTTPPDPSLEETAVFSPTRPASYDRGRDGEGERGRVVYSSPPVRLSPSPPRSSSGRGGCVMGCLAFLIIGAVAVAAIGLGVVRALARDRVRDELQRVVATQVVSQLDDQDGTPELTAGSYVIAADEINQELDRNSDRYDPLKDLHITIDRNGLELSFKLYGTESKYRGGVAAQNGRLVLTDISASGPAGQVLSADDVREIIETELNDYVRSSGLEVTGVELGDGTLTVVTAEAGRTRPAASSSPTPRSTPSSDGAASGPTPTRPTLRPLPKPTTTPD